MTTAHRTTADKPAAGRTLTLPRWKIMETDPRLTSSEFRRSISLRTRPMKAARSLATPLLLASADSALHIAVAHASAP